MNPAEVLDAGTKSVKTLSTINIEGVLIIVIFIAIAIIITALFFGLTSNNREKVRHTEDKIAQALVNEKLSSDLKELRAMQYQCSIDLIKCQLEKEYLNKELGNKQRRRKDDTKVNDDV